MPQLHETGMGRCFFERDMPNLIKQLARIADALERMEEKEWIIKYEDAKYAIRKYIYITKKIRGAWL